MVLDYLLKLDHKRQNTDKIPVVMKFHIVQIWWFIYHPMRNFEEISDLSTEFENLWSLDHIWKMTDKVIQIRWFIYHLVWDFRSVNRIWKSVGSRPYMASDPNGMIYISSYVKFWGDFRSVNRIWTSVGSRPYMASDPNEMIYISSYAKFWWDFRSVNIICKSALSRLYMASDE